MSFGYPGRPPALRHVDLAIAAGETIAIVGPNGAGKSTLAHLLMRLHEPAAGRITIDGIDIATVSLDSLRRQIGVVPQHVLLFNATVRDNIAYGRPEPTLEQIEAAARAARAHDFIVELPQGYDTPIGDRGVRLSGGQQQRVALARALLKDPPILILDEATAMFDPQGEIEFLEAARDALARPHRAADHAPAGEPGGGGPDRADGGWAGRNPGGRDCQIDPLTSVNRRAPNRNGRHEMVSNKWRRTVLASRHVVRELDVFRDHELARLLVAPPVPGIPPIGPRRDQHVAQTGALENPRPGPGEPAHVRRVADHDQRAPAFLAHQREKLLCLGIAVPRFEFEAD